MVWRLSKTMKGKRSHKPYPSPRAGCPYRLHRHLDHLPTHFTMFDLHVWFIRRRSVFMRIKNKLQFRFEHLFISATIATFDGVNRLWLNWSNSHNPALRPNTIFVHKGDLRVVPKLDSKNLLSCEKRVVQAAKFLDFFRRR